MKSIVSAAAAGILLAGCASVVSHKVPNASHAQAGVSYYLPKRMVRATFERVKLVEDPTAKLAAAQQSLTDAEREAAAADAHLVQVATRVKLLQEAGIEPTAQVFLDAIGDKVAAALKADTARTAAADAKRKRDTFASAKLEWDVLRNQCGFVDRFSVTVLPPIPDLAQAYVLEPRHSPTRTENFRIKTTTSGLLSTVEGSIEDQSAAIVVALAQGAAAWKQPRDQVAYASKGLPMPMDGALDTCSAWKPRRIESVLDPMTQWDSFFEAVNADAKSCGVNCPPLYGVEIGTGRREETPPADVPANGDGRPLHMSSPSSPDSAAVAGQVDAGSRDNAISHAQTEGTGSGEKRSILSQPIASAPAARSCGAASSGGGTGRNGLTDQGDLRADRRTGIFYRRELPLSLTIIKCEQSLLAQSPPIPAGSFLLALPNDAPAEWLPMHASPFVATQYDMGFDQGLLVSVDSNRPSEALRIASLPWDVAQATMDVLTSLIRFRVDYTKSDVDLLSQQIEQIKQQQALLEARQRAESPSANAIGSDTQNP